MSKYWKPTMTPNYSSMFKNWHSDMENAPKKLKFMGRETGSNRAFAVEWDSVQKSYVRAGSNGTGYPVSICQWISFTDFADIRQCIWRQK